jgi:hypothetical protein
MRKLKLDLDNMQVESFVTSAGGQDIATIHGYQDFNLDPFQGADQVEPIGEASERSCWASCPTDGCGTCFNTCWNTCNASCPGTSGPATE